jgi:hypothetical protein
MPLDLLGDDIFLEIFDYLNEKDLKICEEVCVRWNCLVKFISTPIRVYERKVISNKFPFLSSSNSVLYHDLRKQMRSSIMWQKYVKIRAKHQVLLQTRYPRLQIAREVKVCTVFTHRKICFHALSQTSNVCSYWMKTGKNGAIS